MATFNKGDVSEGILGAAITARFLNKTQKIAANHVLSVIKRLKKPTASGGALVTTTKFESPNALASIVDDLTCTIGLAPINMTAFLDQRIYSQKDVKMILSAAIAYANGSHVCEWADMLYNNNQRNNIVISSEGLLDQSGTKVDLQILVDGKRAGVGISLKAGDVKQFGQVGGATSEAMKTYFSPLGVNFSSAHYTKFEKLVAEKEVPKALTYMYSEAHKQLQTLARSNQDKFKMNISEFVVFHSTRNEPDVVLVQLNKGEAASYNFSTMKQKLLGINLDVVYEEGTTDVISNAKIPKIKIIAPAAQPGKNVLLELRNKLEGNRINSKGKKIGVTVRNLVEKGHLTTELIAEKYK